MLTISIIIITKNEAHNIRSCLESVKWADEIIVLDSCSTDDTQEICREYTKKIFETDWPGFGIQKNRALQKASGDWILSIDADEVVTEELHQEIINAINSDSDMVAYRLPRHSYYCGKFITHAREWASEKIVRLVKRGYGQFTNAIVHEQLQVKGKIGNLHVPLLHYSYENLEEVLKKMNEYSTYGAKLRLQQGKKGGLGRAIFAGIWAFFRTYVIGLGFLDGREGFMLAVSNAEGSYYRYLKLMLLKKKSNQQ